VPHSDTKNHFNSIGLVVHCNTQEQQQLNGNRGQGQLQNCQTPSTDRVGVANVGEGATNSWGKCSGSGVDAAWGFRGI